MTEAERTLQRLAAEEIEAFNRKAFEERGEFLWFEFPLSQKCLDVLVAASLSHKIPCKGGLVDERGHPSPMNNSHSASELRRADMLGKCESPDEFQPTKLGWTMLRKFAADRARFPEDEVCVELGRRSMYKPVRSMFKKC